MCPCRETAELGVQERWGRGAGGHAEGSRLLLGGWYFSSVQAGAPAAHTRAGGSWSWLRRAAQPCPHIIWAKLRSRSEQCRVAPGAPLQTGDCSSPDFLGQMEADHQSRARAALRLCL